VADILPFAEPGPWLVFSPGALSCIACGEIDRAVTVLHARNRVSECHACHAMSVVNPDWRPA
jgi:hypothetical protein